MNKKISGYYFITDANLTREGIFNDVMRALNTGVGIIQYREKNRSTRIMYEEANKLRKIIKNALFVINDRVDICLAVDADGVHIGSEDLPVSVVRKIIGQQKIIGATAHSVEEAIDAEKNSADYVAVSPIYFTGTKPDAQSPVGIKVLSDVKRAVSIPVVAIGGITIENAPDIIKAGADAICAISAVLGAKNISAEIEKFQKLFKSNVY